MDHSKADLENVLKTIAIEQKYKNCKITVKQINSGGANYTSYIFLATISAAEKKDLKLFVKVAAMGAKVREIAEEIYRNEVFFYTDLMRTYRYFEGKNKIPVEHQLRIAEYYGCSTESYHEILVLEDLISNGFQSFDRFKSVTWDQTVTSIGQLAKFHALSFVLSKERPEEFAKAKERFALVNMEKFYFDIIRNISDKVVEATEDNDKQRIANFIQNTLNSDKNYYLNNPVRKEVLIHGDYRPNNLMYKSKKGGCEVVILDFQTIRCGSPVFDLLYFINFGFGDDFRQTHFHTTIDYYYSELCAALQRLNLDPQKTYSREDFDYEFKEILPFTVLFGLCGLLIVTVDEDAAPQELGNIGPEDFAFAPNDLYCERLKAFINFYSEMGIIP